MNSINELLKNDLDKISEENIKNIVDRLIERLIIEHKKNDKSGIYGVTQYTFSYNSNRMEGSTLTERQTQSLFDTGTILHDFDIIYAKDVEEATGHFSMFNEMLHNYDNELTEELIKKFHFRLKQGVFEDMANGYPCGEYKNRPNRVSDIVVAKPNEVEEKMIKLLEWYKNIDKTLENIIVFHARYEAIHPFQDGNGRTGRMIMFKECLKNSHIPILIKDENKDKYKLALNKAQKTNDFEELLAVVKESQKEYYTKIQEYLYDYSLDLREKKYNCISEIMDIEKDDKISQKESFNINNDELEL